MGAGSGFNSSGGNGGGGNISPRIVVLKTSDAGTGQYTDFTAALAACVALTPTPTNRVVMSVEPGTYTHAGNLIIPAWVSIVGVEWNACRLICTDPDVDAFILAGNNSSMEQLTLGYSSAPNPTGGMFGTGSTLVVYNNSSPALAPYLRQITTTLIYRLAIVKNNGFPAQIVFNDVSMGRASGFLKGIESISDGVHLLATVIENAIMADLGAPGNQGEMVIASGVNCLTLINNITASRLGQMGANFLRVNNGAQIYSNSLTVDNFARAIYVENLGVPCNINFSSLAIRQCTEDVRIDLPGTSGSIEGVVSENKVMLAVGVDIALLVADPMSGNILINGDINARFSDGTITDLTTIILAEATMGKISGGLLSDGGGLDIDLDAGVGYLTTTLGILKKYTWISQSIAIPDNAQRYIYVNENNVLSLNSSRPTTTNNILLGYVGTKGGSIEFISNSPMNADATPNRFDQTFVDGFGAIYSSGTIFSENATPFHLNVSGGDYYLSTNHIIPDGGTDLGSGGQPPLYQYYQDGIGGYTATAVTAVNNTHYDDGSGTPAALTPTFYTKPAIYTVGQGVDEKYLIVLGQAQYATLLLAQQADAPLPPSYFTGDIVRVVFVVIKQGDANIVEFRDSRPILGSIPTAITGSADHTALLNLTLGNAGHTQFMMLNGSTPMTGDQDMGGNNITNIGTVNGVIVETHAARHDFNGADPLLSTAPATIGTANAEGIDNTHVSRSDHVHAHGDQTGPTLHALATGAAAGFLSAAGFTNLNNQSGTNTGDQTITLTGDVTGSGTGSFVATIGANKVVDSMINDVNWSKVTSTPITLLGYGITDAQPLNSGLTAISALTTDAFGRDLLTKTSAASVRTYIGAGTGNGDALTSNPLSQFAATTSAQLRSVLSDENGTGVALFNNAVSPVFVTDITAQLIIGGTGVTDKITYKGTSGNGTTTAIAHQTVVGNNGATTALDIYNDGQIVTKGGSYNATGLGNFRITQGTAQIDIGELSSGIPGLWMNTTSVAPTANNATLRRDATAIRLNAAVSTDSMHFSFGGTNRYTYLTNSVAFTPGSVTAGNTTPFIFTSPASTNQTGGAETIAINWDLSNSIQHASSTAITTQRDFVIQARTHAFASATGTITTAATLAISGPPIAGTNAIITTPLALFVQTGQSLFNGNVLVNATFGIAVGTLPTANNIVSVNQSQNGQTRYLVTNANAGVAANAGYSFSNGTVIGDLRVNGTAFTTAGVDYQNGVTLANSGVGGISIAATSASGFITFASGGTSERFQMTTDGRFYGKALHNSAGAVTGATNQYVASGTYTPTLTNVTNVASSTPSACQWIRVGNVVTVSGLFDVDPTSASVATELGISLPIASALTAASNVGGTASSITLVSNTGGIQADATNDRARLSYVPPSNAATTMGFTFTYVIL